MLEPATRRPRTKLRPAMLAVALLLSACGGPPSRGAPPEEEVDAAWTAGDDEALDEE